MLISLPVVGQAHRAGLHFAARKNPATPAAQKDSVTLNPVIDPMDSRDMALENRELAGAIGTILNVTPQDLGHYTLENVAATKNVITQWRQVPEVAVKSAFKMAMATGYLGAYFANDSKKSQYYNQQALKYLTVFNGIWDANNGELDLDNPINAIKINTEEPLWDTSQLDKDLVLLLTKTQYREGVKLGKQLLEKRALPLSALNKLPKAERLREKILPYQVEGVIPPPEPESKGLVGFAKAFLKDVKKAWDEAEKNPY